ncbi:hypothetical protein L596_028245 [Steinernema carpocapsae]|uniref:Uncharacterized protein n=1 Tax=Steinernema carpocapsae TaxID=34508 RepID=A0A4V5ZXU3_STECR|nr:hypothetical protein L596_028245 [Steinernema carpocapsae]
MLWRLRSSAAQATGRRFYHSHNGVFGFVESRVSAFQPSTSGMTPEESQRAHLINAYRRYGYMKANLDPLKLNKTLEVAELNPAVYGLDAESTATILGRDVTIGDLVEQLNSTYCGTMAGEFMHLNSWEERQWFSQTFEAVKREELTCEDQKQIAELLLKSQNFDNFLALKFPTVKRYGAEGAEAMFAFFNELQRRSPTRNQATHSWNGSPWKAEPPDPDARVSDGANVPQDARKARIPRGSRRKRRCVVPLDQLVRLQDPRRRGPRHDAAEPFAS